MDFIAGINIHLSNKHTNLGTFHWSLFSGYDTGASFSGVWRTFLSLDGCEAARKTLKNNKIFAKLLILSE